jgi:hypothetical protein
MLTTTLPITQTHWDAIDCSTKNCDGTAKFVGLTETANINEKVDKKEDKDFIKLNFGIKNKKGTYIGVFQDWDRHLEGVCILMGGKFSGEVIDTYYQNIQLRSYQIGERVVEVSKKDKRQLKAWRKLNAILRNSPNRLRKIKRIATCHFPEQLGKPTMTFYQRKRTQ